MCVSDVEGVNAGSIRLGILPEKEIVIAAKPAVVCGGLLMKHMMVYLSQAEENYGYVSEFVH